MLTRLANAGVDGDVTILGLELNKVKFSQTGGKRINVILRRVRVTIFAVEKQ
jgi:hypothetical protein